MVALLAVAVAAPTAGAADTPVRPGKGIGRINLGVSDAQLRRVMGKPDYVVVKRATFGRRLVEYQYGLSVGWRITLRGPRAARRVVGVATSLRRERTPEGFGVGTLERKLIAGYGSRLRCAPYVRTRFQSLVVLKNTVRECVVAGPAGTQTVFLSRIFPVTAYDVLTPEDIPRARVIEVGVRAERQAAEHAAWTVRRELLLAGNAPVIEVAAGQGTRRRWRSRRRPTSSRRSNRRENHW